MLRGLGDRRLAYGRDLLFLRRVPCSGTVVRAFSKNANEKEGEMMTRILVVVLLVAVAAGCSSTGTMGIAAKSMADPGGMLKAGRGYTEIGPTYGRSCRFIAIGIIPFGNGTLTSAVDEALAGNGGDALLNVSVTNELYSLLPIYNVFCWTCTSVNGIAIKFDPIKTP
jgi:hypothetical protein